MENLTPIFIALTGAAVLLQAGLLAAMYLAMRKTSTRLEALADEVKAKALPTIESAQALMTDLSPKLQVIADNLAETTSAVREQVQRVDATVNDVVDRARLQVISRSMIYLAARWTAWKKHFRHCAPGQSFHRSGSSRA